MFPARQMLRGAPRVGAQLRNPAIRQAVQRRFASTENAFVKEREAVKEHAAATTGASSFSPPPGPSSPFAARCTDPSMSPELWRKISV